MPTTRDRVLSLDLPRHLFRRQLSALENRLRVTTQAERGTGQR